MSGKRNSLVKSTKDTLSIASKRDNNHHDMKKPQSEYERNQELLRKYIFTEVRHLQKHKSFKTIMKMTSQIFAFVFLLF